MWKFEPTMNIPSCSGPCAQGRKDCPTPEACQQPDGIDGTGIVRAVVWGLVSWLAVAMCAAIVIGAN
jgi:hypothetical protein